MVYPAVWWKRSKGTMLNTGIAFSGTLLLVCFIYCFFIYVLRFAHRPNRDSQKGQWWLKRRVSAAGIAFFGIPFMTWVLKGSKMPKNSTILPPKSGFSSCITKILNRPPADSRGRAFRIHHDHWPRVARPLAQLLRSCVIFQINKSEIPRKPFEISQSYIETLIGFSDYGMT